MGKRLWLMALACLLLLALAAGCAKGKDEAEAAVFEEDAEAGFRRTVLYYASEEGYIVPVMKRIPWEEGIGKAALGYLVDDAANRVAADKMGLCAVVPEGAAFTLRIGEEGAAVVDVTGLTKLADQAAEQAMVTAIVNTLTEFESIETVRIILDGAKAAALPHGTDISQAFETLPLNAEEGEVAVSGGSAHAMTLYFPNTSASLNVPVTRYGESAATLTCVLEALLDGPKDAALAAFPAETKLLSAYIADGVVSVDLSAEFKQVSETEGLCEALQTAITLTANEIESVYGTDIYVEGKEYALHTQQVSAPVYVNEFK